MKNAATSLRNDSGETVTGYPSLRKAEYGKGYYAGDKRKPRPDYEKWLQHADPNGFDMTYVDGSGNYITEIALPKGTRLIRYGSDAGRYTAPKGTEYNELSLPWEKSSCEYHEYIVTADNITVICIVKKGVVAPGFECIGGGVQYLHPRTIIQSIEDGLLEEVELWK